MAFERSALYDRYRGVRRVGSGLGLALVAGLAARLGATATAGSAPEGAAAFTVRLPLGAESAPSLTSAGGSSSQPGKPSDGLMGRPG